MPTFAAALLTLAVPGWRKLGRRTWCAAQRARLHVLAPRVVWVHDGEKMPWALWGADHGFFALEWAHRLPYLRSVATIDSIGLRGVGSPSRRSPSRPELPRPSP